MYKCAMSESVGIFSVCIYTCVCNIVKCMEFCRDSYRTNLNHHLLHFTLNYFRPNVTIGWGGPHRLLRYRGRKDICIGLCFLIHNKSQEYQINIGCKFEAIPACPKPRHFLKHKHIEPNVIKLLGMKVCCNSARV